MPLGGGGEDTCKASHSGDWLIDSSTALTRAISTYARANTPDRTPPTEEFRGSSSICAGGNGSGWKKQMSAQYESAGRRSGDPDQGSLMTTEQDGESSPV